MARRLGEILLKSAGWGVGFGVGISGAHYISTLWDESGEYFRQVQRDWPRKSHEKKRKECHKLYLRQLRHELLSNLQSGPVKLTGDDRQALAQMRSAAAVFAFGRCKEVVNTPTRPGDGKGFTWDPEKDDLAMKYDDVQAILYGFSPPTCAPECPYCPKTVEDINQPFKGKKKRKGMQKTCKEGGEK